MNTGLAVVLAPSFAYEKRNRATIHALEVDKFVTVDVTELFTITEFNCSTLAAKEVFWVHILSHRRFKIVQAAIVRITPFEAGVESALLDHEFCRSVEVGISLSGYSASLVESLTKGDLSRLFHPMYFFSYGDFHHCVQLLNAVLDLDLLLADWAI